MSHDPDTLRFYEMEAAKYTSRGVEPSRAWIDLFLSHLQPHAPILKFGCGAGQDSEFMLAKGFDVRPTDGTPEIAREAEKRLGIPVATLLFGDLNEQAGYDGIWANACLLHVPRAELPDILARIHAALKAGGIFYASFKAGETEGRDEFDRYYNYPSESWLRDIYAKLGWASISIEAQSGSGYDNKPTEWLHVLAAKRS
ncbi:class I SAM-dependent methyltransferase [Pararhizobium sp. DWP1-1-3]|uniref:class I SAM-dependent methyltransferase n=1 Tax=Pararhizobium sp. DWP1-1-3 TaxID=2804652 RepID=UPI003CEE6B90